VNVVKFYEIHASGPNVKMGKTHDHGKPRFHKPLVIRFKEGKYSKNTETYPIKWN